MIVLDTHAWLWWMIAPQRLSKAARRAIDRADRIGVATISVVELVELALRRRVAIDQPVRAWIRDAFAADRVESLPLTVDIALDAAQLHFDGDRADRLIYATARAADARLVTRDERIRSFDPDGTVW